jgi:hypothetical protein
MAVIARSGSNVQKVHALFRSQVPKAHAVLRGFYRIEPVIVMSGK